MQFHRSKIALTIPAIAGMLIPACVQPQQPVAGAHLLAAVTVSASIPAPGPVIREIDDPSTGSRWLLVRDSNRPGGPGRLLFVSGSRAAVPAPGRRVSGAQSLLSPPITPALHAPADSVPVPAPTSPLMIHAGDSLVIEENTPVVDAYLAATALGPAARGVVFNARLTLGGKLVRVLALAPGRAAFLGAQP
jgi:hypothetical protein